MLRQPLFKAFESEIFYHATVFYTTGTWHQKYKTFKSILHSPGWDATVIDIVTSQN